MQALCAGVPYVWYKNKVGLMKSLTQKKLLIVIVILLSIIALPVVIKAYEYGANLLSNVLINAKDEYCLKKHQPHTVKALSLNEFEIFIDREIKERGDSGKYNFFKIGEYKKLSQKDAMRYFYRGKMEDSHYGSGLYDKNQNKCTYSINGMRINSNEIIPWYYF